MKEITFNIKKLCKDKNITLKELSDKMGITQESLSRSINGNPQLSTIKQIADTLNVDIQTLFGNKDEIYGFISYKNKTYIINSIKELKELTNFIGLNLDN